MKKQRSSAQQAALERFPEATRHFNDFSMAQGYAECYRERVEPLVKLLAKAQKALAGTESFIPESIKCVPHESLMKEIDEAFHQVK